MNAGGSRKRILCLDDEPDLLDILSFELQELGFEVVTAISCDQAEQILQAQHIDYILSDVRMPKKSGLDFVRNLRRIGIKTGVTFITAFSDVSSEFMKEFQVDAVLSKPCAREELSVHLTKVLASECS
jgi:two-component system alkaline phosphatase synthesis response regulator PhoP